MIDKFFVKVRSWLHTNSSVPVATSPGSGGSGALTGPPLDRKAGRPSKSKNVRVRDAARAEPAGERKPQAKVATEVPSEARTDVRAEVPTGSTRTPARPAKASAADLPPETGGEAFSRTMEAQPESGMVITESGIIIIDPTSPEGPAANGGPANASPANVVNVDNNWALPNLDPAPVASGKPLSGRADAGALSDDWDQVLARARAQLSPAADPRKRK